MTNKKYYVLVEVDGKIHFLPKEDFIKKDFSKSTEMSGFGTIEETLIYLEQYFLGDNDIVEIKKL